MKHLIIPDTQCKDGQDFTFLNHIGRYIVEKKPEYDQWEVYDYLQPVFIDGIAYCYYFPTGVLGRPATTASAMVSKLHMSCIAGHQQGKQVAYGKRPDGSTITCIIAGSCYEHDETYLGHQGNQHFRGFLVAHEVNNGTFDELFVSLNYLKRRYGKEDS